MHAENVLTNKSVQLESGEITDIDYHPRLFLQKSQGESYCFPERWEGGGQTLTSVLPSLAASFRGVRPCRLVMSSSCTVGQRRAPAWRSPSYMRITSALFSAELSAIITKACRTVLPSESVACRLAGWFGFSRR